MRVRFPLLLILLTLSPGLQAQTQLSWEQSIIEAAQNNAAIKSAQSSYEASQATIESTRSSFYPQVSASFQANYGKNNAIPGTEASDSYAATLSASESIFNGWADTARVQQAEANARIAEAQLQIAKATAAYDLKTAYANLVYAQKAIRLQESIRSRRQANLDLVQLRFEGGTENQGSVLLSRSYLEQADLNTLQARNSVTSASTLLARALGRDGIEVLQVSENVPHLSVPLSPDYQALALSTPQRLQATLRETSAESGITLAKAGYYPSVSVSGSYGKQDDVFWPRTESWTVGLAVSVPLFNGGRDFYATQSAIASRTSAAANRQDLDRQLVATLTQAMARWLEAKKNLEVADSFLKATETRAEIGRARYNNGLINFDDWDLIESDLINRQQAQIQSQRDFILAEAAWENALGTGSIK